MKPSPGRVLWYRPIPDEGMPQIRNDPLAAHVVGVIDDRTVNLVVFDAFGGVHARSYVALAQEGDAPPSTSYAEWMPYQKAVAKGEIPPTLHAVPLAGGVLLPDAPAAANGPGHALPAP